MILETDVAGEELQDMFRVWMPVALSPLHFLFPCAQAQGWPLPLGQGWEGPAHRYRAGGGWPPFLIKVHFDRVQDQTRVSRLTSKPPPPPTGAVLLKLCRPCPGATRGVGRTPAWRPTQVYVRWHGAVNVPGNGAKGA